MFRLETNIKLGRRHPHGKLISVIPMSFSGSRNHILSQLLDGATIYFYPPLFSAGALIEAVRSRGATSLAVVPTILRALLEEPSRNGTYLFPGLDSLYCFGAPILPDEKRRARAMLSRHFVEGYSSSLAGRMTVLYGADIDARPETVGRVLPHVKLEIVDEDNRPLPAGELGAIRVRSPAVARAIYGNVRDSGDQLKDGWAYPGDTGAVDGEGFLELMGRSSDMIIRGGVNVHPSEVEAVLAELAGVKDVAVGASPSRVKVKRLPPSWFPRALTEAALIAHCRGRLVPHKVPANLCSCPICLETPTARSFALNFANGSREFKVIRNQSKPVRSQADYMSAMAWRQTCKASEAAARAVSRLASHSRLGVNPGRGRRAHHFSADRP